jgi:membrane protein implicated in regulation of membrane protease activity
VETYQIVSFALAAVVLVLYLMRRRSRMNRDL